jgi:hypothetical protein
MFKKIVAKVNKSYTKFGQVVGSAVHAPTRAQSQAMLFTLGVGLLAVGMSGGVVAQTDLVDVEYNDVRLANAVDRIFTYLEGSFGALIMVASGLGAIMSAAFGQYKAALGCLVVAVGAFILRSVLSTFFNTESLE